MSWTATKEFSLRHELTNRYQRDRWTAAVSSCVCSWRLRLYRENRVMKSSFACPVIYRWSSPVITLWTLLGNRSVHRWQTRFWALSFLAKELYRWVPFARFNLVDISCCERILLEPSSSRNRERFVIVLKTTSAFLSFSLSILIPVQRFGNSRWKLINNMQ